MDAICEICSAPLIEELLYCPGCGLWIGLPICDGGDTEQPEAVGAVE